MFPEETMPKTICSSANGAGTFGEVTGGGRRLVGLKLAWLDKKGRGVTSPS